MKPISTLSGVILINALVLIPIGVISIELQRNRKHPQAITNDRTNPTLEDRKEFFYSIIGINGDETIYHCYPLTPNSNTRTCYEITEIEKETES